MRCKKIPHEFVRNFRKFATMGLLPTTRTVEIELDEGVLRALESSAYFPFSCTGVEQRAAMVLNRWAAHSLESDDAPTRQPSTSSQPALYVSAPIADLVKGLLHGHEQVGTALRHGNFGLGTLHMLDGEVVVLDGVAYQQTPEGTCNVVAPEALSPFMMVTRFDDCRAQHLRLDGPLDLEGLQRKLGEILTTKNAFWAIKVSGSFSYLKCRAVRKQEVDRPLIEVTREQAIIEWTEAVEGTCVGFFSPQFIGHQLTVPGWHLHFISAEHTAGGHCLGLSVADGSRIDVSIMDLHDVIQEFPRTTEFEQADFVSGAAEAEAQLKEAEG